MIRLLKVAVPFALIAILVAAISYSRYYSPPPLSNSVSTATLSELQQKFVGGVVIPISRNAKVNAKIGNTFVRTVDISWARLAATWVASVELSGPRGQSPQVLELLLIDLNGRNLYRTEAVASKNGDREFVSAVFRLVEPGNFYGIVIRPITV